MKEHTVDNSRHLAMQQEMKANPTIQPGQRAYRYAVERRVKRTIKGTGKVNAFGLKRKQISARALKDRIGGYRGQTPVSDEFAWLDHVDFAFTDLVHDLPRYTEDREAIIGRSFSIARFERTLGFSTIASDQRKRLVSALRDLDDKTFRVTAEFSSDELIATFTSPSLFPDVERITSMAIMMGARRTNAEKFANRWVSAFDSAIMHTKGQRFSSGDEIGGALDLSYKSIQRIVDVPVWFSNNHINYLMRQVGIMLYLTTPIDYPLRKIEVRTMGDSERKLLHALNPLRHGPGRTYLNKFPESSWL
jgi:hypothetical protein